jgi:hypothetical protein
MRFGDVIDYLLFIVIGTDLQCSSCQVCCDECEIWVHVECDQTCHELEVVCSFFFCGDNLSSPCLVYLQIAMLLRIELTDCIIMQDLENAEYFCPDCKSKRKKTLAVAQVSMSNSSE